MQHLIEQLPQVPPFRFVDKIIDMSSQHIETEYYCDPKSEHFKGHFQNYPVMPGVLLLEVLFQSAALLMQNLRASQDKRLGIVVGIDKTRFKKITLPKMLLKNRVEILETLEDQLYILKGQIRHSDGGIALVSTFRLSTMSQS